MPSAEVQSSPKHRLPSDKVTDNVSTSDGSADTDEPKIHSGETTTSSNLSPNTSDSHKVKAKVKALTAKYKPWWVAVIWALVTAFFIAGLALKKKTQLSDVLPFIFLYVFVSGRIMFYYIPTEPLTSRIERVWNGTYEATAARVSRRIRYLASGAALLALVLSVSLSLPVAEGESRLPRMQSLLGIVVITGLLVATSRHRRYINWRTVIVGYLLQFCLGCIV
ncbi:hypothetical protein GGF38_004690, partial [Coemansia sp. RSA 25]